jgi:hyperosmotically inducible protein
MVQRIILIAVFVVMGLGACHTPPRFHSPDDDRVGVSVKRALVEDQTMNLVPVEVDVHDRIVYLTGDVDTARHKLRAEQIARKVEGVTGVVNKLRVRD